MDKKMFKLNKVLIILLLSLPCNAFSVAQKYEIELNTQKISIPAFSELYSEKESSIAPEEYELAENIKSLLEEQDLDKVAQKLSTYYDIELSPALLVVKAQVYFSIQKYDLAEKTYLKVLKRKPQFVRVHEDLGQLYLVQGELNKSQKHISKAISLGSSSAVMHGQLGYINLQLNGAFSAIYLYQKALSLEPDNKNWQQGLLTTLIKAKMYNSANVLLNDLIGKYPKEQSHWLTKAAIAIEQENYVQALSAIEYATLLGDISDQNRNVAISLHLKTQSFDRALELINERLEKGVILSLNQVKEYLFWLNKASLWEESDSLIKQYLKTPYLTIEQKSEIAIYRAELSNFKKQYDSAKHFFEEAVKIDPNNEQALLSYAHFLLEQKDYSLAETFYIRAETFEATRLKSMLGRAQIYVNSNDYSSAQALMFNIIQKYPDTQGIREQLDIIEKISKVNNLNKL